jgi:hypothetical protein
LKEGESAYSALSPCFYVLLNHQNSSVMIKTIYPAFFFALFLFCISTRLYAGENDKKENDIISVIRFGIKNDGSSLGTELNDLVKKSYGKTLYFPAGTYNLSEAIILPFDYTKNVNLLFDKNAVIKTDKQLDALLKIGYSEMSTPDITHRRFSYIEGGLFDCSNADNGIIVNGLKQLVSLRSMSLVKGRKTHIRIHVTDDFKGTGSCDTKIDNITIQGVSSNEEVYGIYVDHSCCDIKMSNTFIYSTKYAIVTRSAGHILNNIHILSKNTTGGLNLGAENYRSTEGIRIENDGFFIFNEIYFDTVDKSIIIAADKNPTLILDKNIYYSYLKDFGTSFLYKDHGSTSPFQVKISNSIIEVARKGYRIFDVNPMLIGNDAEENFSFINCAVRAPHLLNPYDLSLSQHLKGKRSDALFAPGQCTLESQWYALGAILASPFRNLLQIDLSENCAVELDVRFQRGKNPQIGAQIHGSSDSVHFQIGYTLKDEYCIFFIKPRQGSIYPVVNDLLGNGSFMSTPSKNRCYGLTDYGIKEDPILLIEKNEETKPRQ